ncbi:MAG TPA: hypothetical protein VKE92_16535, partial [Anaerolineales bacterium]|nr:hypothetical protein [Anaerolineales bacterium]
REEDAKQKQDEERREHNAAALPVVPPPAKKQQQQLHPAHQNAQAYWEQIVRTRVEAIDDAAEAQAERGSSSAQTQVREFLFICCVLLVPYLSFYIVIYI